MATSSVNSSASQAKSQAGLVWRAGKRHGPRWSGPERLRHIDHRLADLERERQTWESQWRDLARHFLPHRSRFLDGVSSGDRRNVNLYDSTGRLAVRTLASGMQAGLTSPSRPWFHLGFSSEPQSRSEEGKAWLHDVHTLILGAFRGSNFYEQVHTLYSELAVFGTACMLVEEDPGRVARFRTLTAGEYSLDVDALGRVNTLYRRVLMTPAQILEAWPETCPPRVRDMAERLDPTRLELVHAVEPNPEAGNVDEKGEDGDFAFRSTYVLQSGEREILEEAGYHEFPALCPRWETVSGDIYGRSPAMDALPDCRMLQRLTKDGLEALEMEVRPPLNISTGGNEPVDISPAALNYLPPAAVGQQVVAPLYSVKANLQSLEVYKSSIQNQIREALFNNLFLMLSGIDKSMTATEVAERNAEKMLMLGPVLDRMRSEIFQPLILRVAGIMDRKDLLPAPPSSLKGAEMEIEFISILAQAQKQAGISAISQFMAVVGDIARMAPGALDKLDSDETVDELALMLAVPPKLVRSDKAVAELREGRAREMAEARSMEAANRSVEMLGKGARAMKDMGAEDMVASLMDSFGGQIPEGVRNALAQQAASGQTAGESASDAQDREGEA